MSYVSASVLAASPPFELQALALQHIKVLGSSGLTLPVAGQVASDAREKARMETWERWRSDLLAEDAVRAHRGVRAFLPNWQAWRDRGRLPLTLRMTQVLTGHRAFGDYLLRIRREMTDTCHQCQEEQDTAQQTLEFCPAWADQRRVLQLAICESLAPSVIVHAMLRGQREYLAFRSFCEQVMLARELAERVRHQTSINIKSELQILWITNRLEKLQCAYLSILSSLIDDVATDSKENTTTHIVKTTTDLY
ncbi:uncharacterized protein LOC117151374 [Bombus impatiens]|uniref:Uncharacterized protein LOC117151374 n=1 Tax=Bombus impatiens TaxID=132113 RepID=A0A6P8LK72_BOMIM|nr:uncharacterized protein LOC117151374 [Bombus impatiens]